MSTRAGEQDPDALVVDPATSEQATEVEPEVQIVDGVPYASDAEAAAALDRVWDDWQPLMDRLAQ